MIWDNSFQICIKTFETLCDEGHKLCFQGEIEKIILENCIFLAVKHYFFSYL